MMQILENDYIDCGIYKCEMCKDVNKMHEYPKDDISVESRRKHNGGVRM